MGKIVVSSTGLYTPPYSISNQELVSSFNTYVNNYNAAHKQQIEQGNITPLRESSAEFIEKVSGIKSRYAVVLDGMLDPNILAPRAPERPDGSVSIQCEIAVDASRKALQAASLQGSEIDAVILACSNMQRAYPAVAVEIQQALGAQGFGYDMNVACASAPFGVQAARDAIYHGNATRVLVINAEICTGHMDYRDRDSHFIFGDACTALIIESADTCRNQLAWQILDSKLETHFSNNIRNNFGFLNRSDPETRDKPDKLFKQQGRKVFKDVCPMVIQHVLRLLKKLDIAPDTVQRLWLHQANESMNNLIARKILGRAPEAGQAPSILGEYANTSSAGSVIAFHKYNQDLNVGDIGILCAFGAGYSVGTLVMRKIAIH